ncbi:hypothetical protein F5Y14DRAFT_447115 [Nemania sp. NC0429]|nr:hypothetical protein F5Y14DRAFT_447115 [Nemania sp. NC0429]
MSTTSEQNMAATQQKRIPETLRWRPMPAPNVDDDRSSPLVVVQTPGTPVPCRRCQLDSKVGDEMLLVSYDPFLGDSPYRSASPIYLHNNPPCKLAAFGASGGVLPEQQRARLLSVRAYDGKHMLQNAEVVDGDRVLETLEGMLGEGAPAEYCHVHYAAHGCFAVRVERGVGA